MLFTGVICFRLFLGLSLVQHHCLVKSFGIYLFRRISQGNRAVPQIMKYHFFTYILLVFCIRPSAGFSLLSTLKTNPTYLSRLCNGYVWYWHAITIVLHRTNSLYATDNIFIAYWIELEIVCISRISCSTMGKMSMCVAVV